MSLSFIAYCSVFRTTLPKWKKASTSSPNFPTASENSSALPPTSSPPNPSKSHPPAPTQVGRSTPSPRNLSTFQQTRSCRISKAWALVRQSTSLQVNRMVTHLEERVTPNSSTIIKILSDRQVHTILKIIQKVMLRSGAQFMIMSHLRFPTKIRKGIYSTSFENMQTKGTGIDKRKEQALTDPFLINTHINPPLDCLVYMKYIFYFKLLMEQSGVSRQTIDPYYKPSSVFERDEAYYTQMLSGTRRIANNLQGSMRQSSLQKSRSNAGRQSAVSPNFKQIQSKDILVVPSNSLLPKANLVNSNYNTTIVQQQQNSTAFVAALEDNKALKREIDELLNGSNEFGNTSNVVIMQHYSKNQQESAVLKEQENRISQLQQILKNNQAKINKFKNGANELQVRMSNIQSIDRQIFKTLQGAVNRDRELLDRATSALARGQRREDIAKILQQILSP